MNYIRITKENIDKEHICCVMSGKHSAASALSNTFRLKTPGCLLRQRVIFTLTACGYPAP